MLFLVSCSTPYPWLREGRSRHISARLLNQPFLLIGGSGVSLAGIEPLLAAGTSFFVILYSVWGQQTCHGGLDGELKREDFRLCLEPLAKS